MRTLSDFRKMHFHWVELTLQRHGELPGLPYNRCPVEMTMEEYQHLQRMYAYHRENNPGETLTIYGHPIHIVKEPLHDIPPHL